MFRWNVLVLLENLGALPVLGIVAEETLDNFAKMY